MLQRDQIGVHPKRLLLQAALALAVLIVLCMPMPAIAQHHGGGPGGGGFGGGLAGGPGGHEFPGSADVPSAMDRRSNGRAAHGALQVGPPTRWWDDKHYVKQLKLSDDQQRRMDSIFEQSRPVLVNRLEALEKEEQRMQVLTQAKTLDEAALFSQIDRIEQARADLAKANTHYLVQLRNELDPQQVARLEGPQ